MATADRRGRSTGGGAQGGVPDERIEEQHGSRKVGPAPGEPVSGRSLRHPCRGDHRYPRPPARRVARRPPRVRQPRIRPRRQVSVASLVGSPEEGPSRPSLRLQLVGMIVLLLFGVLILRLWSLEVINHSTYAAAVTSNEVREVTVPAPGAPSSTGTTPSWWATWPSSRSSSHGWPRRTIPR